MGKRSFISCRAAGAQCTLSCEGGGQHRPIAARGTTKNHWAWEQRRDMAWSPGKKKDWLAEKRPKETEISFKMALHLGASRGRGKGREDEKGWGIGLARDGDPPSQRWKRRRGRWERGLLSASQQQHVLTHNLGWLCLHSPSTAGWWRSQGWAGEISISIWHIHIFPCLIEFQCETSPNFRDDFFSW